MKKTTVLAVSHSARLYGSERSLLTLIEQLPADLRVAVILPGEGPLGEALDRTGVSRHIVAHIGWIGARMLAVRKMAYALRRLSLEKKVRRVCRLVRPDVVYSNSLATDCGLIAAEAARIPHVQHMREYVGDGQPARFIVPDQRAYRRMANSTVAFICNSDAIRDFFSARLPGAHLHVVHNGIAPPVLETTRQKASGRQTSVRLLVAGSVNPHKNQEEAIRATARMRAGGADVCLRIVGDGSRRYERSLKKLAEQEAIADRVLFAGFQDSMAEEFAWASVVLCPSLEEPFGRIIVEAMLAGAPVVARRSAFTHALIQHGRTGMIYEPGDLDGCVRAVRAIVSNQAFRTKMVQAARADAAARFSVDAYVNGVCDCIRWAARQKAAV